VPAGVPAVATKSLIGLSRSIGYLCFRDLKLTFITRRWFRSVAHSIPYSEIKSVSTKTGFFMDQVTIEDVRGQTLVFDLFRSAPNPVTASINLAPSPAAAGAGSSAPPA
jgi:Bacterial PH domain